MIPTIPWYITAFVIAVNLAAGIFAWSILSSGADRSGLTGSARRRVRVGAGIFLGVWFAAALFLAPAPSSLLGQDPFTITPLIPLFAVGSIAGVVLALWRSGTLRRALDGASPVLMIGAQVYRTIGLVFVLLLAQGQLPAHFALPAGWGDVAVGLTAPLVALALAREAPGARALAIGWNVAGLVDLAVAVGMGTGLLAPLLAPELGSRVPPVGAMGVFPMILVPTFAVPISVLLHALALRALLRGGEVGSRMATEPAR